MKAGIQKPRHLFPDHITFCVGALHRPCTQRAGSPPTAPHPVGTERHKHYGIKVYPTAPPTHPISKPHETANAKFSPLAEAQKQAGPMRLIPAIPLCCSLVNDAASHSNSSRKCTAHPGTAQRNGAGHNSFQGPHQLCYRVVLLWWRDTLGNAQPVQSCRLHTGSRVFPGC